MIKVITKYIAKDTEVENIKEIFTRAIPSVRKVDGNTSYQLYQDVENKNILVIIEEWKNKDALNVHMQTRFFKDALEETKKHVIDTEINIYTLVI